ncbi:exosortase/archaeosortase family protein [Chloroflexota bacterium]
MKIARNRQLIGSVLTGLILIALYCPVLTWLIDVWLNNPFYSHGFLVLPVAIFITWTRRKELVKTKPGLTGIIVLVVGLATYIAGFTLGIYWLWAFSLLVVALGLVFYFWGTKAARSLAFPLGFLIFMIPLPFLDSISIPMQAISASGSTSIIQAIGITATRTGAEIFLPGAAFTIGIPCSGMNTLISLLTLATLFLYFLEAPLYKKVSLFIVVFPIAILANIFRITLLLVVAHFWGTEAAMRYFHSVSSPLVFLFAISLLILLTRLSGCRWRTLAEITNG